MNPFAIAIQGLGFAPALLAMQGLLQYVAEEVRKLEMESGGGLKVRRRISRTPLWLPELPTDEDEALLLIFGTV